MVEYDFYPFSTLPAPYDIVWSRFPNTEDPALPAPKPRPALVRQAFQDDQGRPWVRAVFGTSQDPYRSTFADFTIATLAEMNMCGLKCATRFRLDRELDMPWSREFFDTLPGKGTPIIGHMPDWEIKKLQTQIAFFQHLVAERMAQLKQRENEGEASDDKPAE